MSRAYTLVLAAAVAGVAAAQQNTINTLSYPAPALKPCDSECAAFWDDDLHHCARLQDQGDHSGSIECLCSDAFLAEMETCGTCMVAHPEDPNERLPRYGLAGVAAYFEEQCGRAVDLPGLTPQESLAASLSLPVTTLASASSSTQQASADAAAAPSSASPAQTAVETTTTMSSSTSSSSLSGSPGFATVSAASQLVSTSATVAAATAASADSSPVTSASSTSKAPRRSCRTGSLFAAAGGAALMVLTVLY